MKMTRKIIKENDCYYFVKTYTIFSKEELHQSQLNNLKGLKGLERYTHALDEIDKQGFTVIEEKHPLKEEIQHLYDAFFIANNSNLEEYKKDVDFLDKVLINMTKQKTNVYLNDCKHDIFRCKTIYDYINRKTDIFYEKLIQTLESNIISVIKSQCLQDINNELS